MNEYATLVSGPRPALERALYELRIEAEREAKKTERCIECGVDTGVDSSMGADMRPNYVSGYGQLCGQCSSKYNQCSFGD